jgi:uncharacterized membrane protein YhaH (DUF805 family)
MQRVRFILTMAILSVSLFVATNPVFAAAGGNGNGNGNGKPGDPALPEAPLAIFLPIVGIVVIGLTLSVISRRRSRMTLDAE